MIEIILVENESKNFEQVMDQDMVKAIKHFEGELIKVRTGRAHTSMIEDLKVSAYGQAPVPLKTLAAVAAPDARLLTIQPWDATIIPDIEKAITASDFGVNPENDGHLIRLTLPIMSTSRRDELIKILGKKAEECRVSIRNVRKEFNNFIRDAKQKKTISENFFNRLGDVVQSITDKFIKKTDEMADRKAKDLKGI